MNGLGKKISPDGQIYDGMWKDGLRSGTGTYTWEKKGIHYTGGWRLDKFDR